MPVGATKAETSTGPGASPPQALAGRLRLSMIRLSRQLRRYDPSELTIAQLSLLASVVQAGPIGVGHLAEIEGLPSPAVTRLADKLEDAGLVTRRANPADRRGVHLVATVQGEQVFARRREAGNAWLAGHLSALSEDDRVALERAVGVLESLTAQPLEDQQQTKEVPA
jgi:DNA-binding MarR family transcriptional regulator